MKQSQFLCILAVIYLTPHMDKPFAVGLSIILGLLGGVCALEGK